MSTPADALMKAWGAWDRVAAHVADAVPSPTVAALRPVMAKDLGELAQRLRANPESAPDLRDARLAMRHMEAATNKWQNEGWITGAQALALRDGIRDNLRVLGFAAEWGGIAIIAAAAALAWWALR